MPASGRPVPRTAATVRQGADILERVADALDAGPMRGLSVLTTLFVLGILAVVATR